MLDTREREAIETLSFDAMKDVFDLSKHMEEVCEHTGYRFSLPGRIPCSRSAVEQLRLYQRGRGPRKGVKAPSGLRGLYERHQLKVTRKAKVVTYCDGFKSLSRHQVQDRAFPPETRGEGWACDMGFRRLSDNRFLYFDKLPWAMQEIFDTELVPWLKAHGWSWGFDLWKWDENHFQKT